MNVYRNTEPKECTQARSLFNGYLDDALCARDAFELEKHLADCAGCALEVRQLRETLDALQAAPARDTSDTFMARLHAGLDDLESERVARPTRVFGLRDQLQTAIQSLWSRGSATFGFGLAAAAVAALVIAPLNRMNDISPAPSSASAQRISAEPLARHVALAAGNPLDDPAAANLEASQAGADNSETND